MEFQSIGTYYRKTYNWENRIEIEIMYIFLKELPILIGHKEKRPTRKTTQQVCSYPQLTSRDNMLSVSIAKYHFIAKTRTINVLFFYLQFNKHPKK